MTGADVKAQVMEAMAVAHDRLIGVPYTVGEYAALARSGRALAPCVVLTAEEAEKVRALIRGCWSDVQGTRDPDEPPWPEYALLTPERGDDTGPPAPGEGDDLPNPEMTVEC